VTESGNPNVVHGDCKFRRSRAALDIGISLLCRKLDMDPSTPKSAAHEGTADTVPPQARLEKGDVFRTLGLPDNLIIGLDAMAMTTNKSLPGFRDIPRGAHFLWVQQPGGVSRCGYWFVTGAQGTIRVKEWDTYNEVLREPSQSEALQKHSMESARQSLQPYAMHSHRDKPSLPLNDTLPDWARSPESLWRTLTSAISTQSLSRITGKQDVSEYLVDSMDSTKDAHRGELNFLFTQDFRDLQVLDVGSLQSRVADTSARIQAFLSNTTTSSSSSSQSPKHDILAELQFTFLTGTHLGSPACLDQWWNLTLKLVLRAYTLAISHPRLARDLIRTLHAQLFYTEHYVGFSSSTAAQTDRRPGDDRKDGPSSDRPIFEYKSQKREKLRQMLVEYKRRLSELLQGLGGTVTPEQEAVGRVFEELETWLWRRGWDLRGGYRMPGGDKGYEHAPDSDEEEDEQPVVVELDEEGREVGLVSFRD
jgi:A1 cistron-splicing factor AAR2